MDNDANRDIYVRTEITTGTKFTIALILVFLAALIIILNLPLTAVNAPPWLPELQERLRLLVEQLTPYVIVGILSTIVALAELTSTFQTYPREALRTRWARILILVNVVAAVLALGITRLTMPTVNNVLQVILVGFGFQSLIRTRFVLAKQIGNGTNDSGEISVNLGWLYDQFQNLCRTQIDLELMNNRRTAVTDILRHYPSLTQLYDIAYYTIIARATLTPKEEEERLSRLEKLIDPSAPENFARTSIALLILENGGPGYVNLLMNQAHSLAPESAPAIPTTEQLVQRMVDIYTLDELIKLTDELTASEDVQTWVREAAKPIPETSEANQKAAICHMIIQQVGAETVQRTIASAL